MRPPVEHGAYAPPYASGGRPAVITWLRVYAVLTLLVYVTVTVGWILMTIHVPMQSGERVIVYAVCGSILVVLGGINLLAAVAPYKPWGWIVGLIAICLGLSSCTALAAVPLLLFWVKPETKAAFGRL